MYKLCFFVPKADADIVKNALFALGVGKIGNYDCCCWQTLGQGQFRPLTGSTPHLGTQGEVEFVEEYKVELVCEDKLIRKAITVLKKSHPYEEPAYDVFKMESF